MAQTDSAGTPWTGRHFEENAFSGDDGSAPERLLETLRRFRSRAVGEVEVVDAFRESRLLIPLVARVGEAGVNERGILLEETAELSIVTVAGPDSRDVMPVFSSVEAMRRWNPAARPVPADAVRVALAAASENTELVVLDATSETEFVIRRPALWAIAQSRTWLPSYLDQNVLEAFLTSAEPEWAVLSVLLDAGDADARLAGPELIVQLGLVASLARPELDALLERLRRRWSDSTLIATRVDSLRVRVVPVE